MTRLAAPLIVSALLAACGETPHPEADEPPEAHEVAVEKEAVDPDAPWVIGTVDLSQLPEGPIARGHALATDTHRLLPDNVGNALSCTNCHLQAGTVPKAAPWVGVTDRYPKYRKRSGKEDDLQDRINGCMERSMNGTALERDSEPMLAMVAYMEWLSADVPDGKNVQDVGMPRIQPPATPDPEHGKILFDQKCVACHQQDGSGMMGPDDKTIYPPLWGDRSYNVGAGMARLNTAAAFIKWNMPLGQGGTLTDQEAYDIAAWFIFNDRPDFAGKANDWPKGGKPEDARY
jgi:thiosulfate dehydrogenase